MLVAIKSWSLLVILTILAAYLPHFIHNSALTIIFALIIVVLKGQQIIDVFMELNKAPKFWRLLLLSYIAIIPLVIMIIYVI